MKILLHFIFNFIYLNNYIILDVYKSDYKEIYKYKKFIINKVRRSLLHSNSFLSFSLFIKALSGCYINFTKF